MTIEYVSGVLSSLRVYNKSWGMALVKLDEGGTLRCVGASLVGLKKGCSYRFGGQREVHAVYGKQFDVDNVDGSARISVSDVPAAKPKRARKPRSTYKSSAARPTARKKSSRPQTRSRAVAKEPYPPFPPKPPKAKEITPIAPPSSQQDVDQIMLYECAHHIGLEFKQQAKALGVDRFSNAIFNKLKHNAQMMETDLDLDLALSAAMYTAKSLLAD